MLNHLPRNENSRVKVRKWQLVLCDLDGTLLNHENLVSPENLAAIAALADHQIGFTLSTGRMDCMTRLYVSQLRVTLPIIACNGAVIRDCASNELIRKTCIPPEDVLLITSWMSRHKMDYLIYSPDAVYYPAESRRIDVLHQYNRQAAAHHESPVPLFELNSHLLDQRADQVVKMLAILPEQKDQSDLQQFLAARKGCEAVRSMDNTMDIMASGVSKGDAMVTLADMIGISPDNVVALGDHDNDVSMLQTAGLGIAMGNATPLAVAAGKVRTLDNDQSGVAAAIYRYVLSN